MPSIAAASDREKSTARLTCGFAVNVHAPCASRTTGMSPTWSASFSESPLQPSIPNALATNAVPMVGCPANGISNAGVKMRTCGCMPCRGRMNVVSDRLNCAVSARISASLMPCAFSNTQSGLPPKVALLDSTKTLTSW